MATAVALACGAMGCAYGTPTPQFASAVPKFTTVDLDASEVVLHDDAANIEPDEATTARRELKELFEDATRDRPTQATPARFRAKITLNQNKNVKYYAGTGCAAAGLIFLFPITCGVYVLAGGIGSGRKAHVEIAFETAGGVVTGEGDGYGSGSLYATARRRALAEALERAMADATVKKPVASK